ncbi:MAG: beta-galactosidase, partial [Prevotella sp.]|nr:beta-galactosidase [Prevotella sp.]
MIKKNNYLLLLLLIFLSAPVVLRAQQDHTFEIKGGDFVYDGKPVRIISGEMHYPRIPHQYWR